jgi:hypothetical protein
MATAYSTADSLPFQSLPMAFLTIESGPCDAMNQSLQYQIRDPRHEQHEDHRARWCGSEVVLAHPARRERYERQPEQEMQVGP